MRYNKANIPVEQFLNKAHINAYARYIKNQQEDVGQAKELQDFFQTLKRAAAGLETNSNIIDSAITNELLSEVQNQLSKDGLSGGKAGISKLFRRYSKSSYAQGQYFERELTAVIKAVLNKAFDGNIDLGNYEISTGQKTGTTTITKDMEKKMVELIAKGFSEEEAFKEINKGQTGDLYQKRVQIKTDVQGVSVDINAIVDPKWQKVQSLLQNVTISAKSYRTKSYSVEEKMWKLKELYPTIHLGKAANPYRAIYGTLSDLGYSHSTIESAYFAGKNKIAEGNQNVINHMYHLKYIYELIGAGTKVFGSTYNNVRFLVYNDPTSDNIYVQSAASILSDIFDKNFNWTGDPLGAITISTSIFE